MLEKELHTKSWLVNKNSITYKLLISQINHVLQLKAT